MDSTATLKWQKEKTETWNKRSNIQQLDLMVFVSIGRCVRDDHMGAQCWFAVFSIEMNDAPHQVLVLGAVFGSGGV